MRQYFYGVPFPGPEESPPEWLLWLSAFGEHWHLAAMQMWITSGVTIHYDGDGAGLLGVELHDATREQVVIEGQALDAGPATAFLHSLLLSGAPSPAVYCTNKEGKWEERYV